MYKTLVLLAGAALAVTAAAANAQTPYGYGSPTSYGQPSATLYELPNYQGRSVVIRGQDANLDGNGFNDRARSARFEGAWRVCGDANYGGYCQTLSGNVATLPLGLSASVSSLQFTDLSGGYPGYPGYPGGYPGSYPGSSTTGTATLYEYPNYQGRSITVTNAEGNLDNVGFNDRARSVRLTGTWRLCEDAGFRGHCETVTGSLANLSGRISGLSSLQQTAESHPGYPGYPGNPGYPGAGQAVPGRSVVFYPGAVSSGYGAPYGSSQGTRRAADDFCRQMGNRNSVWFDPAGGRLSDVLCRR